jgi:hypothetical protein
MADQRIEGTSRNVASRDKRPLDLQRRVRESEEEEEEQESSFSPRGKERQRTRGGRISPRSKKLLRISRKIPSSDGLTKKIIATTVANFIFWTAIGFYTPQLGLWVLGIAGLGLKSVPLLGGLVPGNEIYMISWFIIFLIGLCTMLYAALMFTIRRVDCFGGWKGFIFIVCITGYMVIFINFIPFFVIWIISVVLLQGEKEDKK